jgi:Arc/MetJ family transcription regulator
MATNLHLDERLVEQAMRLTRISTKKALVEEGLRALVRLHDQAEVRDLRGRLVWEGEREPPKRRRAGS